MKFTIPAVLMFGFLILLGLPGCQHDPILGPDDPITPGPDTVPVTEKPCSPDSVYFQSQVLPLLVSQCGSSGCHDAASHEDGIVLTSYASVFSKSGMVVKGNANQSKLYKVLFETGEDRMPPPPADPLSAEQKNMIKIWINQGALNNTCNNGGANCNLTQVTFSGVIMPIIANKCKGCHSGTNPSGKLSLTTYAEVKASAQSGKLYGAVAYLSGYVGMPVGSKLPGCEVQQIKAWIDAGYPNN